MVLGVPRTPLKNMYVPGKCHLFNICFLLPIELCIVLPIVLPIELPIAVVLLGGPRVLGRTGLGLAWGGPRVLGRAGLLLNI